MASSIPALCDGLIEAAWLAAATVIPLFCNAYSLYPFAWNKSQILQALALMAAVAWVTKRFDALRAGEAKLCSRSEILLFLRRPLVLPVLFLAASQALSTILSVSPSLSWLGSLERAQGLAYVLSCAVLFFLLVNGLQKASQWSRFQYAVILTSVSVSLFGVVQHLGVNCLLSQGLPAERIAASIGNPIFLGGYLIMVLPFAAERFIHYWWLFRSRPNSSALVGLVAAGVAVIFVALTLIYTQSRGPLMALFIAGYVAIFLVLIVLRTGPNMTRHDYLAAAGLGFAAPLVPIILLTGIRLARGIEIPAVGFAFGCVLAFEVYLLISRKGRRWLWLAWLLQGLVGLSAVMLMPSNVTSRALEEIPYLSRFSALADGRDATAAVRLKIWQGVTDLIVSEQPLAYPDGKKDSLHSLRKLIGYGPETLALVSGRFYKPAREISTRAHNEALDRVATTGFLGLVSYFFLVGAAFYHILKRLGMAGPFAGPALFLAINILAAASGVILPILLKRPEYAALGTMLGLAGAVVVHAVIAAMRGPAIKYDASKLVALCLLTGLMAHFLEIAVGICSITSGTYFFILVGLISQSCGANSDVGDVELRTRETRKKPPRDPVSSCSPVASRREIAAYAYICAIVVVLVDWALVFNLSGLINPLRVFWEAWTSYYDWRQLHEPGLWALGIVIGAVAIGVFLMIAEIGIHHINSGWWRSIRAFLLLVGLSWLAYALLLSYQLTRVSKAISAAFVSSQHGSIVTTLFVVFVFVLACLAVCVGRLLRKNGEMPRRIGIPSAAFGLITLAVALSLAYFSNIVAIQADVNALLGSRYGKQGKWDNAVFFYERAVAQAPWSDLYLRKLGEALVSGALASSDNAIRVSYLDRAEAALGRAYERRPLDSVNLRGLAWVEIQRGESMHVPELRISAIHRALPYFEKAFLLAPNSPDLFNEWSRAYILTGEYPRVDELLKKSLALDMCYEPTYVRLGELHVRQGRFEDALNDFTKAVDLNASDIDVRNNRAAALRALGRNSEAIKESHTILSLAPNDLAALQRLALLYESFGEFPKALEYAERAHGLLPPSERSTLEQLILRLKSEMR